MYPLYFIIISFGNILNQDYPIRNWAEHAREIFCVHWNLVKKDTFITGSWDQTIKIVIFFSLIYTQKKKIFINKNKYKRR